MTFLEDFSTFLIIVLKACMCALKDSELVSVSQMIVTYGSLFWLPLLHHLHIFVEFEFFILIIVLKFHLKNGGRNGSLSRKNSNKITVSQNNM